MKHGTIDQHAKHSSFYGLDPRGKVLAIVFFVVVVAMLTDFWPLVISAISVVCLILISNIPLKHIGKRYLITLPFIAFASLSIYFFRGIPAAVSMLLRISSCVLLLILLSSSTPFFDLLKASRRLKMPKLMLTLLMFLYRYLFVFTEEYQRMRIARKARGFSGGKHLFDKKSMHAISQTAGMVLVRAYQRGVRIYDALISRGYDGEIKTLTRMRFRGVDYAFCFILLLFSSYVLWMDWMVIG